MTDFLYQGTMLTVRWIMFYIRISTHSDTSLFCNRFRHSEMNHLMYQRSTFTKSHSVTDDREVVGDAREYGSGICEHGKGL